MLDARAGARGRTKGLAFWMQQLSVPKAVWAASAMTNVLGLALPLTVLVFYDRIIPKQAMETLLTLGIVVGLVIFTDFLLNSLRSALLGRMTARFSAGASVDALARYLGSGHSEKSGNVTGTVERIDAIGRVAEFYGGQGRLSLIDLPFAFVFLIVLMLIGGLVAVVPVAILVAYGVMASRRAERLASAYKRRTDHDAKFVDFISESLGQIVTVKGLAMEALLGRRFERLQETDTAVTYDMLRLSDESKSLGNLLTATTTGTVVTVGALLVIGDFLTVGSLAACTMLAGRIVQPAIRGMGLWSETQKTGVALEEIEPLFENEAAPVIPAGAAAKEAADIQFRNVTYVQDGKAVMDNISIDIPAGSYCAFRSNDDAGTLFVEMVAGRLVPDSGEVLVGGVPAHLRRLNTNISVCSVSSRPTVFRGTIIDNLTLFGRGPSVEIARQSSRMIGLETNVDKLRQGYDTPLGEGVSETLPAGVLQQISISRALALGPNVMLLDQPQSSLDREADVELLKAFAALSGHMTLMVVSNRPSYLKAADAAFDLIGGHLQSIAFDMPQAPVARDSA